MKARIFVRPWLSALVFMTVLALPRPSFADLYKAALDYDKKEFENAFREYRALAELGQPIAQYNLAAMYANGQGVEPNLTNAHAWASLARNNGVAGAQKLIDNIQPRLTPNSLKFSEEMQEKFSAAALTQRLIPSFLQGRDYADRQPVRRDKSFIPQYPFDALQRGIQGEVVIEFVVAPDGRARLPRIISAIPSNIFDRAAREAILRSTFSPARIADRPTTAQVTTYVNFAMHGSGADAYPDLERYLRQTLKKAEAGDSSAQLVYGLMLAGLPQLGKSYSDALPWFVKAAQAGNSLAQYQVGSALLRGRGCLCDETKAETWLQRAAQADQSDAQVTLAERLLKGVPTQEATAAALVWLERAAQGQSANAKLYLAALLSTSAERGVRDGHRAVKLVDQVFDQLDDDPTTTEIRAAAYAARGDFDAAVKDETKARAHAKSLGWDLEALDRRLAAYNAHQTCTENLLTFEL